MNLRKYNYNRWNLAFFDERDLDDVITGDYSNVHWMKYDYRDRWFVDPFILLADENIITVLAEELEYKTNKGRIAKLIVDRQTWDLKEMKIILELDTHLSFPMILRRGKEIIIIPENSASKKSFAYRYNPTNDEISKLKDVCDLPLTDATVFEHNGRTYMLSTSAPTSNGNELIIFEFDKDKLISKESGKYTFESNIARNAGSPFVHGNKLYRPAQDCNGAYGKGVILQEMIFDNTSKSFIFHNKGSIYPFNKRYQLGIHTLNCCGGLCVIDARGLLYPTIGRILRPFINLLHK